jgi:glutaredoxin
MPHFFGSSMKRSILWLLAGGLLILSGFFAGNHFTRLVREFMAPDRIRVGDFRRVTDAVGTDVVLISTTSCPWCEKARTWLDARRVIYRDCQVDVDPFARYQLEKLDADTVPQLVSGTTVISGYDEEAFEDLIGSIKSSVASPPANVRCADPS